MSTSNILDKEIPSKNALQKLFQMNQRVVAQSNLPIFFQELKWLKWKELDHRKNADHSMDFTKTLNASLLITKDKNSASDLAKEKKEPVRLSKKQPSKMDPQNSLQMQLEVKSELNIKN